MNSIDLGDTVMLNRRIASPVILTLTKDGTLSYDVLYEVEKMSTDKSILRLRDVPDLFSTYFFEKVIWLI